MKRTISKKLPIAVIALVCVVAIVVGGCGAGNNGASSSGRPASSAQSAQGKNNPSSGAGAAASSVRFFTQSGDWIYYHSTETGRGLYKIRTDGSEKTQLNDDNCQNTNIYGDWVYYQNANDNNSLYKIKTDGSERIMLDPYGGDMGVPFFNIVDDWIYAGIKNPSKIRTDGSGWQSVD